MPDPLEGRAVIVDTPHRTVALLADEVETVQRLEPESRVMASRLAPGAALLGGVASLSGELVYLYDANALLTGEESNQVEASLAAFGT